jgi:protein SCO1/2
MSAVSSARLYARLRLPAVALIAALLAIASISIVARLRATIGNDAARAPDFTLVDQDGQTFALSAQRGRPVVLFFGYTHCPDACPLTLAHLAVAMRSPGVARDVRVAFITVDPERDTPAKLKRYVGLFDPRFSGLTGSPETLAAVYSQYHVWHEDVPFKHGPGNYSVAHGTTIYYIGRNGSLRGFGNWDDPLNKVVHDLKEYE